MNTHHDTTEILDTTNTLGTAPTAATRAPRRRRNAVVAGLALVGLLGAAAGVVVVTRGGSDTPAADRTPAAVRDHRPATAPAAAKTNDPQATNAPATGVDAPVVTAGSVAPLDSVPSSSPAPGGGSSGSSLTPAPDPAPGGSGSGSGSGVFCCVKLPGDLFSPPTPPLTIDPGVLAKLKPVVPVPGPFPGPGWLDFP